MLGYGGLSIVISLMVVLLLSGIILGQIALFRGEKPVALPSAALTLNVIALVYLLFNLPR